MDVNNIISVLRREMGLDEAAANERAYAMLATIKSKHPRLKIALVVIENQAVTVCLKNGTHVRFDPLFPVPVWRYPSKARAKNPKWTYSLYEPLVQISGLMLERSLLTGSRADERCAQRVRKIDEEITTVLEKHYTNSIKELEDRVHNAYAAEDGDI